MLCSKIQGVNDRQQQWYLSIWIVQCTVSQVTTGFNTRIVVVYRLLTMNTKSTCSNQDGKKVAKNKNKSPNSHSTNVIESKAAAEVSEGNEDDDSQENTQAKFEVELRWCIEKLQTMMSVPNLSQKQIEVKGKALGVLIDSKASVIKKRSIMRTSLGDYRLQLKNEEQKYIKESKNMKVIPVASCNQKGMYLKKSSKSTQNKVESAADFKFNFLL